MNLNSITIVCNILHLVYINTSRNNRQYVHIISIERALNVISTIYSASHRHNQEAEAGIETALYRDYPALT